MLYIEFVKYVRSLVDDPGPTLWALSALCFVPLVYLGVLLAVGLYDERRHQRAHEQLRILFRREK